MAHYRFVVLFPFFFLFLADPTCDAGGDSGIGRATAILAALEGANVALAYLPEEQKDAEDVKRVITEKTAGLRKVLLLPLDLKAEANCIQAVERTVQEFGRLDTLFNKYVSSPFFWRLKRV
jgi:NAD(P)-dependent dehydrogenase (short-subunit alcohol dehydrogenase family)